MQSRLRVLGHPIQPLLVTFPFGLFVCAAVFDLVDTVSGPAFLGEVGYWTAVAALVTATLSGVAGMVDLWDVPGGRIQRIVVTFNLINAMMAALFVFVCLIRAAVPGRGAPGPLVAVELAALILGGFGVRLGTVLVRHFDEGRGEATTFDALGAVPGAAQPPRPPARGRRPSNEQQVMPPRPGYRSSGTRA